LHFIILSFPKFTAELQEEKFELIATSLKNAKAVIIYFFSDQRNQTASSILINNIRLSSIYNSICVRDCSENPFLIRLFGEVKKIVMKSPTRRVTPTEMAGRPKNYINCCS
jgi:mitochondrial fission protein ELM1